MQRGAGAGRRRWHRLVTGGVATLGLAAVILGGGGVALPAGEARYTFHDGAGFARYPVTITRLAGHDVDQAARAWNAVAGRELLVPVDGDAAIDVVGAAQTWVRMGEAGPDGAWQTCTIHVRADESAQNLTHEIGHCLGLADVLEPAQRLPGHVNPILCADTHYRGIMAYCGPRRFSDDDLRAVAAATGDGYDRAVALVAADAAADALAASQLEADLLFVTRDTLPAATRAQLAAYDRAYLVGGTNAVSSAVEAQVARLLPVERLAGADRFETAALVARVNEIRARDVR